MKVEQFASWVNLANKTELENIEHLVLYFLEDKEQAEFTVADMSSILVGLGYGKANGARLKGKTKKSSTFVNGSKKGLFKLSVKRVAALRVDFSDLSESEEIISNESLLSEILFKEANRLYLLKVAQQINATYENNLFDGCALMTRLSLETLLIQCFESVGIENYV